MKSIKKSTIVVLLLMAALILGTLIPSLCGIGGSGVASVADEENVASAATITTHGDGYGQFANGSSYAYTDVTKIVGFRAATPTQKKDSTSQKVDTTVVANRGTAVDPYVITTPIQWNKFADDANAKDATKVFVLGADIDFKNAKDAAGNPLTFKPVPELSAKFYGCNYYLKNVSYSYNNANGNGGLFLTIVEDAVVADLSSENFSITNSAANTGSIGGIVGWSKGHVLNCHTIGSIKADGGSNTRGAVGGVVGKVTLNTKLAYVYRCSSLVDLTLNSTGALPAAGIVGKASENSGGIKIFDCFAISKGTFTGSDSVWFGGIFTISQLYYEGAIANSKLEVENAVGYTQIKDTSTSRHALGTLFNGYGKGGIISATVKNSYTAGTADISGTNYNLFAGIDHPNDITGVTISASNINYCGTNRYVSSGAGKNMVESAETQHASQAVLYDEAVKDDKLAPHIWVNKSVIDEAYMMQTDVTKTTGYTIENSPVRSPLIIKVQYYNYTKPTDTTEAETLLITGGDANWFEVDPDELLKTPDTGDYNTSTHIFMGWTYDKTGNTAPITTATGILGEVKLYAVWDVPDNSATPIINASTLLSGNDLVNTQGTATTKGSATMTYSSSSSGKITLTPNLQISVMSDPVCEYAWFKGAGTTSISSDSTYSNIQNVADSDDYSYKYAFYSKSEPLWRSGGTGHGADKKGASTAVTINPAPVYVDSLGIGAGEHAYVGMAFSQVTPIPVMVDDAGNEVAGTATWAGTHAYDFINDLDLDSDGTLDGKTEQYFTFTPTDPNYVSDTFKGSFDIEYLKVSFILPAEVGKTITETLEYNQLYTFKNVADLFDSAFAKDMGANAMPNGYVPYLKITDTFIKIDSHKKNNATAYTAVQENKTVEVEFRAGTYTVTLDPNIDGDNNPASGSGAYEVAGITYGRRLGKQSNPSNGTKMFLGWYYDVTNDTTGVTTQVAWDFDKDLVTDDITLTAKWLEPNRLISITVKPKSGARFEALTELDLTKIEVEATFECDMPDGSTDQISAVVPIDDTNITLTYLSSVGIYYDELLHVNGNQDANKTTTITVKYTTNIKGTNQSASADLTISVDPILISTDNWDFDDARVTYDGTPHTITGVGNFAPYDSEVTGVTYKHLNSRGQIIDAADVVNVGRYTVIASFETTEDYKANDRRATLQIVEGEIEVHVTWDSTSFVYNGLQQYPTPTFTDASGNELPLKYTVSGVDNAINVDSYTITITLTTAGYNIKAGEESTRFTISKATLPAPTLKEGDIIYICDDILLADHLDGFDPNIMEIASGGKGFDADSYTAVVKFRTEAAGNCSWQGSSASTVNVKWEIKKATAIADWGTKYKFPYDGSDHRPELVGILDVLGDDQLAVKLENLVYEGDINVSAIGSYTVSVRVPSSEMWFKNYTLENESFDFVIVPDENVELVSVIWDKPESGAYVYNGDFQAPTYTVVDMDGNPVSADVLAQIEFDIPNSRWAGDYTATANVKAGANYFIRSGGTCSYKIVVNAQGEGNDPGANNTGNEGGNGGSSFIDKLLASHFPLWQVATMAAAGLLSLIFVIKAAQYGSRAKKAKGEAKKISSRAYAAFLPIFSTEAVALGLSNKIWSIMAFAFVGLALLLFVVAMIMRSNWKKAELAKENAISESEQRKSNAEKEERREFKEQIALMSSGGGQSSDSMAIIEEMRREMAEREERYRRDEEERRRNDEERHRQEMDAMKMMLAGFMGGRQQGDEGFAYASIDDTDMLVQRVIAGLLPAVQQMIPEATAYLAAPQEQNDELIALVEEQRAIAEEQRAIVEEQNEEIRNMSAQMSELQEQLAAMSQERADAVVLSDNNDEIMAEMSALREQLEQLSGQSATVVAADNSDELKAMTDEVNALRQQIANLGNQPVTVVAADNNNDEVLAKMKEMQKQIEALSAGNTTTVYVERDADDDGDDDDEEEWDSILDEDDDDFVESVVVEADGTVRKASPNFRMRLKESSDKNREWYAAIKNLFCSQKGITYRVYKRVEKIRYQGNVIAVIGIAKRSIKLWLALKPYEFDARRYHHKDVSDKPRFVDVPLYVRVGSDRALTRAEELILALFQEQAMEARKRYTDRDIQELIFTLKYNKLLTKKGYKQMLCQSVHVHDCDVLDNETAEKCIEVKNVDYIDDSVIEAVKLDDIDANFQDGNRVTLDKLRKVGLVSEQCTGYTVTAGQRLTKPLIVVANDFTMEAIKMIALTGGRVVRLTKV